MKKIILMCLVVSMIFMLMPRIQIMAEETEAVTSGTCGENLTWELLDGVLNIQGSGEMTDYQEMIPYEAPWYASSSEITSIVIGSNVTSIGDCAFSACSNLTSVKIQSGVASIGACAFRGCRFLTSVEIPSSVTSISDYAFDCRNLKTVNYTGDIEDWCAIKFGGSEANPLSNSIAKLYINDVLIENIEIPSSVTSIGNYTFSGYSSLVSLKIPSSVTSIGRCAFSGCSSLVSVEIPNSVMSIGDLAFSNCSSLVNVEIPSSVTSIEYCTFSGCSRLASVKIPPSITYIEKWAFESCYNLRNVTFLGDEPMVDIAAFYGANGAITGYYPMNNDTWSETVQSSSFGGSTFTWKAICAGEHSPADAIRENEKTVTCTENGGYDEVVYCSICGYELSRKTTKIVAEGHAIEKVDAKEATCTERGNIEYYLCTTCDRLFSNAEGTNETWRYNVETEFSGHSWQSPVIIFDEDGRSATATFTCKNDESHKRIMPAAVSGSVKKAPTCTEKGITTYTATAEYEGVRGTLTKDADTEAYGHRWRTPTITFAKDGKTATATFVCSANEEHVHTMDARVTSEVSKPATCTEKGITTYTAIAEYEGVTGTLTKDVEDIEIIPHSKWMLAKVEASCTSAGYTGAAVCKNCGVALEPGAVVQALGHSWNAPAITFVEDGKSATATYTCKTDQSHTHTVKAEVKGEVKTPATCTEKGVTRYTATTEYDGVRGTLTKDVEDIEALGHNWKDPVITFAENGKTATATFTCKSDESHTHTVEAVVKGEAKKPATCIEKGVITYTATAEYGGVTGTATKDVADIEIIPHTWLTLAKADASCTSAGYTGATICKGCGELKEGAVIEALGHAWDAPVIAFAEDGKSATATYICKTDKNHTYVMEAVVTSELKKPATCTEKGITTYTATVEHEGVKGTITKDIEDIAIAGHNELIVAKVEASCVGTGFTGTTICKTCGITLKEGIAVEALGHKWDNGNKCTSCGTIKTETTPANGDKAGSVATTSNNEDKTANIQIADDNKDDAAKDEDGEEDDLAVLEVGEVVTDDVTDVKYKIIAVGTTNKTGTVEYVGTVNKKQTVVKIPETVEINGNTYKITSVAANAFKNNKKLTEVSIGKNVVSIGKKAFNGCKKLKLITIQTKKLTSEKVGSKAFSGIYSKAVIKVPKKNLKLYSSMLRTKGVGNKATIEKL